MAMIRPRGVRRQAPPLTPPDSPVPVASDAPTTPPPSAKLPSAPASTHRRQPRAHRDESVATAPTGKKPAAAALFNTTTAPFETGEPLAAAMHFVNRRLNGLHEPAMPKYTSAELKAMGVQGEYGGITGTIRPKGVQRILEVMCGAAGGGGEDEDVLGSAAVGGSRSAAALSPELLMRPGESVFCDIGSGTGRPVFYAACLDLRASVGFDICSEQVRGSYHGLVRLQGGKAGGGSGAGGPLKAPVVLFQADVTRVADLAPTTHAYSFLGYSAIVAATSRLVARSQSVRVFACVVLHAHELRACGLLAPDKKDDRKDDKEDDNKHRGEQGATKGKGKGKAGAQGEAKGAVNGDEAGDNVACCDDDVRVLPGMQMPAGNSYTGYVIPMTPARRRRVLAATGPSAEAPDADLPDGSGGGGGGGSGSGGSGSSGRVGSVAAPEQTDFTALVGELTGGPVAYRAFALKHIVHAEDGAPRPRRRASQGAGQGTSAAAAGSDSVAPASAKAAAAKSAAAVEAGQSRYRCSKCDQPKKGHMCA